MNRALKIYRPPSSDINEFNSQIYDVLNNDHFSTTKEIVVMGDFNINLLNHNSHIPTSSFLNIMLSFGLMPAINRPTRTTSSSNALLDNIFTNFCNSKCKCAILYSDISDHFPVLMQYRLNVHSSKSPTQTSTIKRSLINSPLISLKIFYQI